MPKREYKEKLRSLWSDYGEIILFVVVLFAANFFWKWSVSGDEHGAGDVTVWGVEATGFFSMLAEQIASAVYSLVHLFRSNISMPDAVTIAYDNGVSTRIIWGCTPVKQIFIFTAIMLFTPPFVRGAWHKLWYIPFASLLLYGFNILRIAAIALIIENHPETFDIWHGVVFKYCFYAFLFLLWLFRPRGLSSAKAGEGAG